MFLRSRRTLKRILRRPGSGSGLLFEYDNVRNTWLNFERVSPVDFPAIFTHDEDEEGETVGVIPSGRTESFVSKERR